MTQAQLVNAKFFAILLALIGGFVLVAMGKLDAAAMYSQSTTMVGALVVALGITGAGAAASAAIGNANNARLALMRPPAPASPDEVRRGPQAGYATLRSLFAVLLFASVIPFAIARCGGSLTPQQATDIGIGVNASACVIINGAVDWAAGMSPPQIVADLAAKCGLTFAQVSQLFDASAGAQDKLGNAPLAARYRMVSVAAAQMARADGGAP